MSINSAINIYLAARRAGGFKLDAEESYLRSFARFAATQGDTHVVARTAVRWAEQAATERQSGTRLKAVIRFARFSRATDQRYEIPPERVFRTRFPRPTPHLFTKEEVLSLMEKTAQLGPSGSLRPHTYKTLIGLLWVTGMRISEALGLRFADIAQDGLVIRATKFRKSRLLPIDVSTRDALEDYLRERRRLATTDDHIFVSHRRHRQLGKSAAQYTFRKLLSSAGLDGKCGTKRPRLMDFRHTFASNALRDCPDGRDRVDQHILALMTYLGHARPDSTYWYLESSPLLMIDIANSCERIFAEAKR
jgi:integrase